MWQKNREQEHLQNSTEKIYYDNTLLEHVIDQLQNTLLNNCTHNGKQQPKYNINFKTPSTYDLKVIPTSILLT